MKPLNISNTPFYINPSGNVSFVSLKEKHYRKYKCRICSKEFKQSGHLDTHIRLKHSEEKPFECNFPGCNKSFPVRWALKTHLKIHKEKDKSCNYCNKRFHQKVQLINHIKFKHLGISFDCNFCGKQFESKYILKYHLKKCDFTKEVVVSIDSENTKNK